MPAIALRDVDAGDAPALAGLAERNRADIERLEPPRPAGYFTVDGQRRRIAAMAAEREAGSARCFVIVEGSAVIGDLAITGIERRWLRSAHVGYLVDRGHRDRGVATAAVRAAARLAFSELCLHRLDAGVLTDNAPSRRVLEKAGFRLVGLAERFLFVGGAWRDHLLYELVGPDMVPTEI